MDFGFVLSPYFTVRAFKFIHYFNSFFPIFIESLFPSIFLNYFSIFCFLLLYQYTNFISSLFSSINSFLYVLYGRPNNIQITLFAYPTRRACLYYKIFIVFVLLILYYITRLNIIETSWSPSFRSCLILKY